MVINENSSNSSCDTVRPRLVVFIQVIGLAAAYFVAGWLARHLAIPPNNAVLFWPAAGIAVVAVLVFGYRVLLGVWLGAFLANTWAFIDVLNSDNSISILVVGGVIGCGATLQAFVGAWLARRKIGFSKPIDESKELFWLMIFAGPVACIINAVIGMGSLVISGGVVPAAAAGVFATWWIGDVLGVLVVVPLFFAWRSRRFIARVGPQVATTFVVVGTVFVTLVLFFQARQWELDRVQLEFEQDASSLTHAVVHQIENSFEAVHALSSFYAGSVEVNREKFHTFTKNLLDHNPDIQALSWNPKVSREERVRYEQAAVADGYPDFKILEKNKRGGWSPRLNVRHIPLFILLSRTRKIRQHWGLISARIP